MPDPAHVPDPADVVRRFGGVLHRQDLLRLCSRRAVDAAVGDGRLVMPSRSWVGLPDQARDLYAARAARGVVGGLSAALHHRWPVKTPPDRTEVIVPANRGRLPDDLDVRRRDLAPSAFADGVLTPAATVVDCALAHPFDVALCVADSALRSEKVTRQQLAMEALPLHPRLRTPVAHVLDAATHLSANPFESTARAIALGVPGLRVVPQGDVDGIGHADLVDHRLRIAIECDSHEFHSLPEAFRYDVRRYTRMALAGWLLVRFVWEDVMHRPDEVRTQLVRAVEVARARSGGGKAAV